MWTTKTPTEPGHYWHWARGTKFPIVLRIVEVDGALAVVNGSTVVSELGVWARKFTDRQVVNYWHPLGMPALPE